MKKILIYGTSNKALAELTALSLQYEVLGFVDSNIKRQGKILLGLKIYHYSDLENLNFDLIIICSDFFTDISNTLKSVGIDNYVNSNDIEEIQKNSAQIFSLQEEFRSNIIENIPQIPLQHSHIKNCTLLVNRLELLQKLPQEGIAAELGVDTGSFSSQILKENKPKTLHLIDVWDSTRFNQTLLDKIKSKFEQQIRLKSVVINRSLSHEAVHDFPDNYFDWIYIDTTHKYLQTKLELELYAQKIKPGGIIAGHDYCMGNWEKSFKYGVIEAVHEFCVTHKWRLKYLTMDIKENQSFAIEKIN